MPRTTEIQCGREAFLSRMAELSRQSTQELNEELLSEDLGPSRKPVIAEWSARMKTESWTPLDAYATSIAACVQATREYFHTAQKKPSYRIIFRYRARIEDYEKTMVRCRKAALRLGPYFTCSALPSYEQATGVPSGTGTLNTAFLEEFEKYKIQEGNWLAIWQNLGDIWCRSVKVQFASLVEWYSEWMGCSADDVWPIDSDRRRVKQYLQDVEEDIRGPRYKPRFEMFERKYADFRAHRKENGTMGWEMRKVQDYLNGIQLYVQDISRKTTPNVKSVVAKGLLQRFQSQRRSDAVGRSKPLVGVTGSCLYRVKALYDSHKSDTSFQLTFSVGQIIDVFEIASDGWWLKGRYIDCSGKVHAGAFPRNLIAQYHPELPAQPSSTQDQHVGAHNLHGSEIDILERKMEALTTRLERDREDWLNVESWAGEAESIQEDPDLPSAYNDWVHGMSIEDHEMCLPGYALQLMLHNPIFSRDESLLPSKLTHASPPIQIHASGTLRRVESLSSWLERERENYLAVEKRIATSNPLSYGHDVRATLQRMSSLEAWLDQNRSDYEHAKKVATRVLGGHLRARGDAEYGCVVS